MGDVVTVQVARVDVDERKIDLELLSHAPIRRSRKPKGRRRPEKKPVRSPAGKAARRKRQRK